MNKLSNWFINGEIKNRYMPILLFACYCIACFFNSFYLSVGLPCYVLTGGGRARVCHAWLLLFSVGVPPYPC